MNVANLDLCRELYKLSGWEGTSYTWYRFSDGVMHADSDLVPERYKEWICRAYDLGYLLRKLPAIIGMTGLVGAKHPNEKYAFCYMDDDHAFTHTNIADTPEDAACKLAIELFKQGALSREGPAA